MGPADPVGGGEADQHDRPPDDDVDHPVVAGADDDDGGAGGVRPAGQAQHRPRGVPLQRDRHPQRPPGVQRRERGELVGEPADAARGRCVRAPPPVGGVQAEDVDVPLHEPRRRRGQEQVGDESEQGRGHQGPAGREIALGAEAVEPQQADAGHHVVRGGVPVAAQEAQRPVGREHVVEQRLPVDAEPDLHAEQLVGAVQRRAHRGLGEQPGRAVGHPEAEDEAELEHGADERGMARTHRRDLHGASLAQVHTQQNTVLYPHLPRIKRRGNLRDTPEVPQRTPVPGPPGRRATRSAGPR